MAWKAELGEANKQLVNVKLKHLEREKEWQNIEEQNVRLLEKRNMMVEHLREELMLQRQIAAGKEKFEKLVKMQEGNNSNVKEEMISDEDRNQEAFEKQNMRQNQEEEDSSASTEAFELNDAESEVGLEEERVDSYESASKGEGERSPSYFVPRRTTKSNNADGHYNSLDNVDDLLGGMSEDEDEKPEWPSLGSSLLSDRLQSMISTNDQPSSLLERSTSCKRRKLDTADEKSEGSQVDVEAATDTTGLKEEGEDLQCKKSLWGNPRELL